MKLHFILRGFLPRQYNTPGITKNVCISIASDKYDKYEGCVLFLLSEKDIEMMPEIYKYILKKVG